VAQACAIGEHECRRAAHADVREDLAPSDVASLGKKRPADAQVKIMADLVALLRSTPGRFKRRQRGPRPVVTGVRLFLFEDVARHAFGACDVKREAAGS